MDALDPKTLLKAVGRGKTLSRDLTREEMRHAMHMLLTGGLSAVQVGAFLQALRIKETKAHELAGALEAATALQIEVTPPQPAVEEFPIVLNLAFDSRRKPTVLSLLAARYLAGRKLCRPLVVWSPGLNSGVANPLEATDRIACGHPDLPVIPTFSVDDLLPAWKTLAGMRSELGFRTILNTLEKLLRPWPTAPVVLGIAHDNFLFRLVEVLTQDGVTYGAVVMGNHGTCDLGLGENPTELVRFDGLQESVGRGLFPWMCDSSVHLIASQEKWPDWLTDSNSPLWNAIRCQAAFLLTVARPGCTIPQAIELLQA
jgi:anthranilate phosphoribosyltransferase